MTVTTEDTPTTVIGSAAPPESVDGVNNASSEGGGDGEAGSDVLIEEDLLVEDVSIDGMCGVY